MGRKPRGGFLKFVAYLQVMGIILVVFGHSFHEYPDGETGILRIVNYMMYSFRMPLFMFVSGFLMVYTAVLAAETKRPSVYGFTKNKVKRLLVPFVTLSLVTFLPRTLMSGMADDGMAMSWGAFLDAFLYKDSMVIPYYWFVQASFLLLIFNFCMFRLAARVSWLGDKIYLLLIAFFAALPLLSVEYTALFSLNMSISLGIYFVLGATYARYRGAVDRCVPWTSPVFTIASAGVWAVSFFQLYETDYSVFCSVSGILMCVSTAKIMEKHNWGLLDHLVGANYMIFLTSWYLNVLTQQVLSHFVALPWWVHTVLSLVAGIYVPWLGYRYLKSHRHSRWAKATSFLLGQNI